MNKLKMKEKQTPFPKVKVKGRNASHTLNLLFFDWPATRIVVSKLVAFLAVVLPETEVNVAAQRIVENALKEYSKSIYHLNIHKTPDPDRMQFFVEAVISNTNDVLQEAGVTTASVEQPLFELLTSEQLKTILQEKVSEKAIMDRTVHSDDTGSRGPSIDPK